MNISRNHARRAILMVGITLLSSSTAQTAHESEKSVPVDQVLGQESDQCPLVADDLRFRLGQVFPVLVPRDCGRLVDHLISRLQQSPHDVMIASAR